MDVTLVTARELPEADVDEPLLLAALAARGLEVRVAAWNDPDVDWTLAPLTVLRSCWDYHHERDRFLDWARTTSAVTGFLNPLRAVSPNTHKSYLGGLQRAGVPVVPTAWFPHGGRADVADKLCATGWGRVVVKPAVSAGSWHTRAWDLADPEGFAGAVDHVTVLAGQRDTMVQPYLAAVDDPEIGERSVVWIAGEFTHAVRKTTRFAEGDEQVSAAVPIADDERALAERVLRTGANAGINELLYARIDLTRDGDGALLLMELELVEPSLYLLQHPPAAERFADAITMHARAGRSTTAAQR